MEGIFASMQLSMQPVLSHHTAGRVVPHVALQKA